MNATRNRSRIRSLSAVFVTALSLVALQALAEAVNHDDPPSPDTARELSPINATLDQLAWMSGAWAGPGLGGGAARLR